jgi:hypothetical protein
MRTLNNEIIVHKGDSFTVDKIIKNKDGSPYIISNKLNNPYFLITVADSKYAQSNRYVKNYWLDLTEFPRFLCTQPVDLFSIKTSATSDENKYDTFPDELPEGFVDGVYVQYEIGDAVFFIRDEDGKAQYKYYDDAKGWLDYKCQLVKSFSCEDTEEWVSQNYVYSIRLVSGIDVKSCKFEEVVTILPPTRLSVLSNISGGC